MERSEESYSLTNNTLLLLVKKEMLFRQLHLIIGICLPGARKMAAGGDEYWFQEVTSELASTSIGFDTPARSPTASRKAMNRGWGRLGRDRNSGWNCVPSMNG